MLLNLALALALAPAAAAAGDDAPIVVATTSIWADIVDQVDCGDTFDVQTLIPTGGDPHSYEPSMQDRDRLDSAALVVVNGAGLEESLADTIDAAADEGATIFAVADHVTTSGIVEGDEHDHEGTPDADPEGTEPEHEEGEEGEEEHHHDGVDPHVWLDPTLVIEALPVVGDALVVAGADAATIDGCVADVTASLEDLDAELTGIVDTIPADRRILVTNHDALGYFARHYGFEVLGSVLPSTSTLVEASPSELDELGDAIEAAGVPAIFAEALETTDDASALGERLGVDVVTLYTDSLGEEGSGADTYQGMLRADATAIADALNQ